MPLPSPTVARQLRHTRNIHVEIFRRDDGLWDVDARMTDIKSHDVALSWGVLPAKKPIHNLLLRLTVDQQSTVVQVQAALDSVPFAGFCDTIGEAYSKMIGLNLLSGFRQGLRERLSGIAGCTHLNELAMVLPDTAAQVFAFENRNDPSGKDQDKKPFELDNCHALQTNGAAVALYYPRWVTKPDN